MTTTMNMSSYEIEQDTIEAEYGEEIMSAGWNPAVDLVCQQLQLAPTEEQVAMVADLALLDTPSDVSMAISDIFLRKMYSYQR